VIHPLQACLCRWPGLLEATAGEEERSWIFRSTPSTEFVPTRTEKNPTASRAPSILALAPVAEHPAPELVRRLEHEYVLSAELDRAWTVRPILLTRKDDRTTLVLEDPGGQPLDLLTKPADLGQFL
jgi:hypothetical protein